MGLPYFIKMIPRHPEVEGSGDPGLADTATDHDGGGHYNPDQPRDWHGRWTAGPDQLGGAIDLMAASDGSPVSSISFSYSSDVPAWKAGVFAGQPGAWQGFTGAVADLPQVGDAEAFTYGEIFAAEGGIAIDPSSKYKTSSGITIDTLNSLRGRIPGLSGVANPAGLSYGQRAAIYRAYMDDALKTVGGYRALETLGNPHAASALADTLFRFGPSGGTGLLQDAMNLVMPGVVGRDSRMGPGTLGVFREFASDPSMRARLLDKLYEARKDFLKGREEDRNQHFRYLGDR